MSPHLRSKESWRTRPEFATTVVLLDSISALEQLSQAVQGLPLRSIWHPTPTSFGKEGSPPETAIEEHINTLQIPRIGNHGLPALQLYRLGSFATEGELRKRKEDIFSGDNSFLLNTSGTGKTRLLFEGLCEDWGLYFTSQVESSFLGSFDVEKIMIERLEQIPGFVSYPSLLPEPQAAQAIALNIRLARTYSSRILLARLLIFQTFLDCAESLGDSLPELKRFWLHFQLRPTLQSDSEQFTDRLLDVSLDIIQALSRDQVDEVVAASVIAELSAAIIARLGKTTRIFIVLDEANAAANAYERSFRDDDGNYYPLLKVILKTWKDILQDMPFIFVVAGSEIPEQCFAGEIEWKNFVWKSNTGGFDTAEKQRCYIQQFLPDNLRESVGDPLMQRMWRWVRGRHRFTSACIAVLLENSYAKPFAYLDMIIHRSTGYLPCADLRYPSPIFPFGLLDFEVMRRDRQLRSYVHLAVIDPLVSSSNPGFPKKAVKLINEGMGRFTDSRCTDIVIDEPLVIARAVAWFTSCEGGTPASILEYQYFVEHLIDPGMAPRHPPAYLAFALALAFSKSRRISDILLMSRPVPLWSRRAHIVARTRQPNLTLENPVRDVNGTHQTLVTYSTSLTDTLQWLRHSHPTPFCIHVTDATATLIFIVKLSNGGRFWAVMRALYSLGDRKDVTTKIQDTLHSLKPENLFQHPSAHEPSSNIFSALDSLPNICPQVGPHGILPVIAIIGKDVDRNIFAAPGLPLAALLNLNEIRRVMDIIPSEKVAKRIVDSVTRDVEINELACFEAGKEKAQAVSNLPASKRTYNPRHEDGDRQRSAKMRPWR